MKPDYGQPDGIGPVGASGGKNAARFMTEGGMCDQTAAFGSVKSKDNHEVGKALDVLESLLI